MANQLWRSSRWILRWCQSVSHWPRLFNCSFGGPRGNHHGRQSFFLFLVKTRNIVLQLLGWVQLGPDWLHLKQWTLPCVFISERSNPLYYGRKTARGRKVKCVFLTVTPDFQYQNEKQLQSTRPTFPVISYRKNTSLTEQDCFNVLLKMGKKS